jgi:signal transduction histidine kinase
MLDAPAADLIDLALFLPISGGLSLLIALGFLRYQSRLLRGLKGKLLAILGLVLALMLLNVGFTAYLMFFSAHDLQLLLLLMLYSLGICLLFAAVVAGSFAGRVDRLLVQVERMGRGNLQSRVESSTGDEIDDIASAFNVMARQLEEAASQQQDLETARRHLISSVSHDLRTPLASMRAMLESMEDGVVSDPETVLRYHRRLSSEVEYLSRLIEELFELSQIDSGLLELHSEATDISDLIADTLEALRPQAMLKQLSLEPAIVGTLPLVEIDALRMQRVLYNLVQNALRHTPPDGTVVVRAADTGSELEIAVQDNGEGVEPEDLPEIFERFYRGSRARTRTEAGSGLGLTIARAIVELHGGRIWAHSERGHGATFFFTVPKAAHHPSTS